MLIRRKDGQDRWCLDYQRLNNVTKIDVFTMPRIDECLDTLSGNVWISMLVAYAAFHQIKIRPKESTSPGTTLTNLLGLGSDCVQRPGQFGVTGPHLEYSTGIPGRRLGLR